MVLNRLVFARGKTDQITQVFKKPVAFYGGGAGDALPSKRFVLAILKKYELKYYFVNLIVHIPPTHRHPLQKH